MQVISQQDAKKQGLKRYFTGKPCKHGHVDEHLVSNWTCCECNRIKVVKWQQENPEKAALKHNRWRENHPGEAAERAKQWYIENPERHAATMRAYFDKNPHLRAKLSSKQRAATLQRTPKWLTDEDYWMLNEIYQLAALRTAMTGVEWHVDHTIPLRGRLVSGLHTPLNLRVIPASDNLRKGNRYATH